MISKVEIQYFENKEIRTYHYDEEETRILHPIEHIYNIANNQSVTEKDNSSWLIKKKMKKDLPILLEDTVDRRKYYDRNDLLKIVTPSWVKKEDIRQFYEEAKRLTKETGIKHQVDHIIPLKHPLVCGLHVKANLRVITQEDNYKKNNKFIVE